MDKKSSLFLDELREKAEKALGKVKTSGQSLDSDAALHELRVHQIELEMQNQELREAQLALQSSRDKYLDLYHNSPVGHLTLDSTGRILDTNETFARMVGAPLTDLPGKYLASFIGNDSQAIYRHRFQPFYKKPDGKSIEVGITRKDGEILQVLIQGYHQHDPKEEESSEKPLLGLSIADISGQRKVENALLMAESVINFVPDGILVLSPYGEILNVNPAFSKITGYQNKEIIGRPVSCLSPLVENGPKIANLLSSVDQKSVWRGDVSLTHKDGQSLVCALSVSGVFNSEAESVPVCVVAVLRDVSIQRRTEKKLQETQKMDSLGTLAGGLAHNFNNLLAGMMGNLFLIKKQNVMDDKSRRRISAIEGLCTQAKDLLKNLLLFTRTEVSLEGKDEQLNLRSCIEDFLELYRPVILDNVRIELDLPDKPFIVSGSRNQLMPVLLNLLTNALHATRDVNEPKIAIALQEESFPLTDTVSVPGVCLVFSDNGYGMDEAVRSKIFDPFFTTKAVGEGSGLGLATVYGSVKKMGGEISVESRVSQGTAFRLLWPLSGNQEIQPKKVSNLSLVKGNEERILVVEDNELLREALDDILQSLNYQVIIARDGSEALSCLEKGVYFDLIITDAVMPEMGGKELIHQVRTRGLDMPVLMITANPDDAYRGADEYGYEVIAKPFNIDDLSNKIRDSLMISS